ncbi:MAG: hypothetical protein A3G34_06550 [Candidatus Lindowbacteria bacterium RIFCSPLOWO2_12_FULL_62_27]|nr:MAG: hypothetical protein A3G34_06550 [Candidatus Lindowbacteria bacterium RIFCSPLOWO2_12_FULL_62_27]OGH63043.1 MAG: hypothetical protein A3I06_16450 [Candidatus Lindowbacteria bacterium RIFCSPLOWO2_02_FULL_62_12]
MRKESCILSNGFYSVLLTNGGGGKSFCSIHGQTLDLTRWRDDPTTDGWGPFIYARDRMTNAVVSAAFLPVRAASGIFRYRFSSDKSEYVSSYPFMELRTEIVVTPNERAEIRRVTISNLSDESRDIELTSYLEAVLAPASADLSHPAFSNLFVQTQFDKRASAILAFRRPRSANEKTIWMFHTLVGPNGKPPGRVQYETDRARFIGRGRTVDHPAAMEKGFRMSGSTGAVLDPILSLRTILRIPAGAEARVSFITGAAPDRRRALEMISRYHNPDAVARVFGRIPKNRAPFENFSPGPVQSPLTPTLSPLRGRGGNTRGRGWDKKTLVEYNGLGGFSADGREYIIVLEKGRTTPAPWVNVVSNPRFGFQVSESGAGYTWSENSRENKLTPWSNDPVSDPPGEVLYLRDEETGEVWTTTCSPIRDGAPYVIRHGQGYSVFEHSSHGMDQRLSLYCPMNDPVKIYRLVLKNRSGRYRKVSATLYAEWVLGVTRPETHPHVESWQDRRTGILMARNRKAGPFPGRVAFLDCAAAFPRAGTCSRAEFLGPQGVLRSPAAFQPPHPNPLPPRGERGNPQEERGIPQDPCAALQVVFDLAPNQSREIVFLLGQGRDAREARAVARKYRKHGAADRALAAAREHWDRVLGAVQVRTPDRALDLMLNRWLLYQTLSCRIWSRSAFYQSGGAFGFRDQLQDARALVYSAPHLVREHILRSAARQFVEGDVQHWWHPPFGMGPRTRCSDDLLFLPYVVSDYIAATGDHSVLNEKIPYVEGKPVPKHEQECCFIPRISARRGTLYEHCLKSIRKGVRLGRHGLPLIGSCDWNDGMNRVGHRGKGESVWLGWFLIDVLNRFSRVCESLGDGRRAQEFRRTAGDIAGSIERHAWDGGWYRRAYMDDGTPLGAARNDECRIDSLAQSWAVISGAADRARARRAMKALDRHLIRRKSGLILLLTPPFDRSKLDPGYIKGYVAGVRENGGQYSHASTWVILAYAMLKDRARAVSLFNLINPVRHAGSPAAVERYKVEPYVMAADVYGVEPYTGRGGWTWYTGSAGWMYRIGIEWLLGLKLQGKSFTVDPCVPADWPGYSMTYRYRDTVYRIEVSNTIRGRRAAAKILLDGRPVNDGRVPLTNDRRSHAVRVYLS